MLKSYILILALSLLCYVPLSAQFSIISPASVPPDYTAQRVAPESGVFSMQAAEFSRLVTSTHADKTFTIEDFPLQHGQTVTLRLRRFDVLAAGAQVIARAGETETPISRPAAVIASGDVAEIAGSFVYMAMFEGYCSGYVEIPSETGSIRYVVAPLELHDGKPSVMITYRETPEVVARYNMPTGERCGAEHLPDYDAAVERVFNEQSGGNKKSGGKAERVQSTKRLVAQIAIDCDFALYQAHQSNVSRAVQYVLTVMGASSAVYQRDANVMFQIPYLRVWTTDDPYPATDGGMLGQFRDYWNANMQHVKRTLAHVMSGHGFGGVAWVGVLCANINGGFGYAADGIGNNVTYPSPAYVWDVDVVSHEMGHNFGSSHTHNCGWNPPIDSCVTSEGGCYAGSFPRVGTIMSYCHLTSYGTQLLFHPRCAALIRRNAENAACVFPESGIVENDVRVARLVVPEEGGSYVSGKTIMPECLVENIGTKPRTGLVLTFSIHNPTTNAELNKQTQTLPAIAAGETLRAQFPPTALGTSGVYLAKFALENTSDTNTNNDAVTRPFTVQASLPVASVSVEAPNTTLTLTSEQSYTILWKSTNVQRVRLEYSTDNGNSWLIVNSNYPADSGKFVWTVPPTPTTKGRVRIADFANIALQDISDQQFTIVLPTDVQPIDIISPALSAPNTQPVIAPRVVIRNNGSLSAQSIPVRLTMTEYQSRAIVYNRTVTTPSIAKGSTAEVAFPEFDVVNPGLYMITVRTLLSNDMNVSNDSLTREFTATAIDFMPILISPFNKTYSRYNPAKLSWRSAATATIYQIQLDTTETFETPQTFTSIDTTTFTPILLVDSIYYWRVRAVNDTKTGAWSVVWRFTPVGWRQNPANGYYYAGFDNGSWNSKNEFARSLGAQLATIRSLQENLWLRSAFPAGDLRIGLTDRDKEGSWQWSSGEPQTYYNWGAGEPNNAGKTENYGMIRTDGRWNDVSEGVEKERTILEIPRYRFDSDGQLTAPALSFPADMPQNIGLPVLLLWKDVVGAEGYYVQVAPDAGFSEPSATFFTTRPSFVMHDSVFSRSAIYYWRVMAANGTSVSQWSAARRLPMLKWTTNPANGRQYIITPAMNWTDAQSYARTLGGNLTTIRSKAENDWLQTTFGKQSLWIGINDVQTEGTFRWASGEAVTYTNWAQGEPNDYGSGEDFGHLRDDGQWNDNSDGAVMPGIVELATQPSTLTPPVLLEPTLGSIGVPVPAILRWNKVLDATGYVVQFSTSTDFSSPLLNLPTTDTILTASGLPYGKQVFLRTRSAKGATLSDWSGISEITTAPNPKDSMILRLDFETIRNNVVYSDCSPNTIFRITNALPALINSEQHNGYDFRSDWQTLSRVGAFALPQENFTLCFYYLGADTTVNDGVIFQARTGANVSLGARLSLGSTTNTLALTAGGVAATGNIQPTKGIWNFIAITRRADTVRWYTNASLTDIFAPLPAKPLPADYIVIGGIPENSSRTNGLPLHLDDIRLYSRALSGEELAVIWGKPVSVEEDYRTNNGISVSVAPNPAADRATIKVHGSMKLDIVITDALGRMVECGKASGGYYEWNTEGVASGLYTAIIRFGTQMISVPVSVHH